MNIFLPREFSAIIWYCVYLLASNMHSGFHLLYFISGGLDICKMMGAGVGEAASYCIAEGMDAGKEMQELGKI